MVNTKFTGLSDAHIRSIGRDQRGGKLSRLSYQQAIERIGMSPCQPVDVFGVEWQSSVATNSSYDTTFHPRNDLRPLTRS